MIYDKGAKNIQWRKDNLFNKLFWENWIAICKRIEIDHYLTPYTKIKSNIRPETIKLLIGNIGSMLFDISLSPQARKTETKINKWYYIKSSAQQRKPSIK